MKLPGSAHRTQPWRIHEIAYDFDLFDVWALPTPGESDDFPRLVEFVASFDPSKMSSRISRTLFAIREKVGGALGLDDEGSGIGSRVPSLRERLPDELRGTAPSTKFEATPFEALYETDTEFAAEIANKTVHGVLHLGWVEDGGGNRGQLAILVKPNGLLGRAYLAAIRPFRHLIVYPALMRDIRTRWERMGTL